MQRAESTLENKTRKILWIFEIETDLQISAKRPDLVIVNKKKKKKRTSRIVNFALPADHRVKLKESEKKHKYQDLAWELKQIWKMKMSIISIVTEDWYKYWRTLK